ncbi:MAG: TIGR02757 family protein [Saprospiraceae bacterium]|nr:TIGR02757 family protein [Saprospiraceae bacterium]
MKDKHLQRLKALLDDQYEIHHQKSFIELDPISIPHRFVKRQDIEISAFWTATISWGNRKSIIQSANALLDIMGNEPYRFVMGHTENDLKSLQKWGHRTFQGIDALGFVAYLKKHYQHFDSLEDAFLENGKFISVKSSITSFGGNMFSEMDIMAARTRKHVSDPARGSACKRLNMFLRWMVRSGEKGVDFGLWTRLPVAGLMLPLDVHVERVARNLGMIERKQRDWLTVEELTYCCRLMDPQDPVKYDYALFGMGVKKISPDIL